MSAGSFQYLSPPLIRWGEGAISHLASELKRLGVERPFLVTTRSIAANPAVVEAIRAAAGRPLVGTFSEVRQHAPRVDIDRAVAAALEAGADGLISAGGGSPIDAAKVVGFEVSKSRGSAGSFPHVAIPTTLSMAELAPSAGVTNAEGRKAGMRDISIIPSAVIYDGALAVHTPLDLWLSTGIRSVDHAVETVAAEGGNPLSETLALEGIRRLFAGLPKAKAEPGNAAIRTENLVAGWLSYTYPAAANGLSHTLGKLIGSPFGIPHGVTSCVLLPHVMNYLASRLPSEFARIGRAMGVPAGVSDADAGREAGGRLFDLIASLGLPQHLRAFNLTDEQLEWALQPMADGPYPLEDLRAILRAAA
jgi:3-oxoacid CoA-transferase